MEMQEEMGPDNIFIFGMTVDEVTKLKRDGQVTLASLVGPGSLVSFHLPTDTTRRSTTSQTRS